MRHFEFTDGKSSKFWDIEQDGTDLNIRWGRIGTTGQRQSKSFADAAKATAALEKLISEKTRKGYVETAVETGTSLGKAAPKAAPPANTPSSPTQEAAPADAPTTAPPSVPSSAQPTTPADATPPPWLAHGTPILMSEKMREEAWPSRRFPKPVPALTPAQAWQRLREEMDADAWLRTDFDADEARLRAAAQRMHTRASLAEPPPLDGEADALFLALLLVQENDMGKMLVDYLVARDGLPQAVDIWLAAQRIDVKRERDRQDGKNGYFSTRIVAPLRDFHLTRLSSLFDTQTRFSSSEIALRTYLAAASETDWAACAARIEAALPGLHPARQVVQAMLLPERPELSNALLLHPDVEASHYYFHYLLLTATAPAALEVAVKIETPYHGIWWQSAMVATLIQERGIDAVAILAPGAAESITGDALTAIGTPEAVMALAKEANQSRDALARLMLAIERWPLAALVGLARRIAAGGKDAETHLPRLIRLLRTDAHEVERLRPWLEPGAQAVIDRQLAALSVETAEASELPEVLRAPPWLSTVKKKPAGVIELEPLPLEPIEKWQPGTREAAIDLYGDLANEEEDARRDSSQLLDSLGFRSPDSNAAKAAIAQRDAPGFINAWRKEGGRYINYRHIYLLPDDIAVPFWNTVAATHEISYSVSTATYIAAYAMARLGLPALPGLIALVQVKPLEHTRTARNFAAVELALPMATAFSRLKKLHDIGRGWLLSCPEHAACGLIAPALGKDKDARASAGAALRLLHAHGHGELLFEVAHRYQTPVVVDGLRRVLDESPLDRFPGKRPPLPAFWQPRDWRQPLLLNGKTLPADALDHLGQMLTFPAHEEVYAGLTEVKTACQPDTLADFAWDAFNAWLEEGAPGKENWALTALGTLGNDDSARKLTPLIRAWPGESAHARATVGLAVLERIGTDVALMMLNGIAQKLKYKALQDKAREKINIIAQMRDLTPAELEDRLAPDLGLDEQGSLRLDFGPRAFHVSFDEALKPYVRELDPEGRPGKRLSDLPKPKKTDDAEFSKAAVDRFKRLKKDARTIASQQLWRLETAMCTRRYWTPGVFQPFMVEHPLMRHMVQRLIWAVYAVADADSSGGNVQAFFRVAEDGRFTTAEDDPFILPEGEGIRVGIPHALELPEDVAAAFGQLFADYELLQPFEQIGRAVYTLSEDEKTARTLTRWEGIEVPSGRVMGLTRYGWERGVVGDGAALTEMYKPLASGQRVELHVTPGFSVGAEPDAVSREQEIYEIRLGGKGGNFGTLDPIAVSELLRDLETLRA